MNRTVPLSRSRMANRKGRSKTNSGGADSTITTAVAAAASVPSSSTFKNVFWITRSTQTPPPGTMREKSARPKASTMPSASRSGFRSCSYSISKRGSATYAGTGSALLGLISPRIWSIRPFVLLDRGVDHVQRGRDGEVQLLDPGTEVLPDPVVELGDDRVAKPGPDRVAEPEGHAGVQGQQQVYEVPVRLVDGRLLQPGEPEHVPHLGPRVTGGPVPGRPAMTARTRIDMLVLWRMAGFLTGGVFFLLQRSGPPGSAGRAEEGAGACRSRPARRRPRAANRLAAPPTRASQAMCPLPASPPPGPSSPRPGSGLAPA